MNDEKASSALEALSDEEYHRRVDAVLDPLMDGIEAAIDCDDPEEAELRFAAAPTALRNVLAQLIAEECHGQPRPYRLVKEMVRDLDLERIALAMLKNLETEAASEAAPGADG